MGEPRKSVFLSYAHEDRKWAEELRTFLAPWIRDKRVDFWDDSRIEAGEKWEPAIDKAIAEASVAVLLVTRDFLASEFIMNEELPRIMLRVEANELRLIWIAVSHAAVDISPLSAFQAGNDPEKPIKSLVGSNRDKAWVKIANLIANSLTLATLAVGLDVIDETSEPIEAKVDTCAEDPNRKYGIQSRFEPSEDRIAFTDSKQVITFDDVNRLADDDQEYIDDGEERMRENYERWRRVRKQLGKAGGALDDEVDDEIKRIEKLICEDLDRILDFILKMLKYELEDHYGRYRHICGRL